MRGKNKKSFLENVWMIPVLFVLFVFFIIGTVKMYGKNKKTHIVKEELQEELVELEEKYDNLENKLKRLATDRGIEEELRDQYHVVEDGEEQIVIIENEPEDVDNNDKSWLSELFHGKE